MPRSTVLMIRGVFFTLLGVFTPWFAVSEYFSQSIPGSTRVSSRIAQLIFGHQHIEGWALLVLSLLLGITLFWPQVLTELRRLPAQRFLIALMGALVLLTTGTTLATVYNVTPYWGLLVLLVGFFFLFLGIRSQTDETGPHTPPPST